MTAEFVHTVEHESGNRIVLFARELPGSRTIKIGAMNAHGEGAAEMVLYHNEAEKLHLALGQLLAFLAPLQEKDADGE